jgi:uncharacterized protein involved in outer membrane biogenesis
VRGGGTTALNAALQGYSVRIGGADFNPWNFSLELSDLVVLQQAHPDPPVLDVEAFEFSVEWRALLRLQLVADARIVRPRLFVHLAQLREERDDDVDLDERGWQEALEEAYPLKINALRIAGGSVTYVDEDPERPLELSGIRVLARNLRNVEDPESRHPSPSAPRPPSSTPAAPRSPAAPTSWPSPPPPSWPTSASRPFRSTAWGR